ncbi:MAG: hypothetical protein NTZ05_21910 [Chloroflexi bacterium]|nr:hypothetical protein [Chloroflexota bacterium]
MAKWKKTVYKMTDDHTWSAPPGHKIFVADAGALRFNYPAPWVVIPTSDAIELHDRKPPKDDCLLKVSVMYLKLGINWSGLPMATMLLEATKGDARGITHRGEVVSEVRKDLELAWYEMVFTDQATGKEALSRACLSRNLNIMPFITMDFWPEHLDRFGPVWDEVLRSLQVGGYIHDPTRGPVAPPKRGPLSLS